MLQLMFENLSLQYPLVCWLGFGILISRTLFRCLYNLYFHPLRKIPGPWLAAATGYYEFWFEVVRDGMYLWEIEKMHEKYGPIVRVNPREIHIRDSAYYNTIYTLAAHEVQKDVSLVDSLAFPGSVATTIDHHLHRSRRGYLNPYFSKRAIYALESNIHERISKLCQRFENMVATDEVVVLDRAFSALTADIVTQYVYGEHYDYLSVPDFTTTLNTVFHDIAKGANFARFFPAFFILLKKLPPSILRILSPGVADLLLHQQDIKSRMSAIISDKLHRSTNSGILASLVDDDIPPEERSVGRILNEGAVILLAGTETTARTLSVAFFYLLQNTKYLDIMREEINAIQSSDDIPPLTKLERLPYLRGIVNESLRLSFGPVTRLPRVAPTNILQYRGFSIPPGTPVSQSTYFVHTDPVIFPEPFSFDPTRWIRKNDNCLNLESFLTNFTKGTRQCLGIQLAYAELYLAIASVARKFDMKLYETTVDHVKIRRVRLLGYPETDPKSNNNRGQVMVKISGSIGLPSCKTAGPNKVVVGSKSKESE